MGQGLGFWCDKGDEGFELVCLKILYEVYELFIFIIINVIEL